MRRNVRDSLLCIYIGVSRRDHEPQHEKHAGAHRELFGLGFITAANRCSCFDDNAETSVDDLDEGEHRKEEAWSSSVVGCKKGDGVACWQTHAVGGARSVSQELGRQR